MDLGDLIGRGISFPPRVGLDGHVAWSEGADNVRESIRVILTTEPRQRLLLPDFGCGLGRFLFEPNTVATRQQIQDQVLKALAKWEPRITVEAVLVDPDPQDPEAAIVTITYRLIATQARERVQLSVTLRG
jgi:phage baseplate assembly protein W